MRFTSLFVVCLLSACADGSSGGIDGDGAAARSDGTGDEYVLAAGSEHSCVGTAAGNLMCFGRNEIGQLGDRTSANWPQPVHTAWSADDVVEVALSGFTSCAIRAGGEVSCWGAGLPHEIDQANADLDATPTNSSRTPIVIQGVTADAARARGAERAMALGIAHACVVTSAAGVSCWGAGGNGQLGDGLAQSSATPVRVASLANIREVAASGTTTCALDTAGTISCWGENADGQVGNGEASPTPVLQPTVVAGVPAAQQIALGDGFGCAMASGDVYCWGVNDRGQTGTDPGTGDEFVYPPPRVLAPQKVEGLGRAQFLAASSATACAVLSAGTVVCWGEGRSGQLGIGRSGPNVDRTAVKGITSVPRMVTVGSRHACAATSRGTYCWGSDRRGQRGDGAEEIALATLIHLPLSCAENRPKEATEYNDGNVSLLPSSAKAYDSGSFESVSGPASVSGSTLVVEGALSRAGDVDSFVIDVVDGYASLDPVITLAGGDAVQVCAYYKFDALKDAVTCTGGSPDELSYDYPGCCTEFTSSENKLALGLSALGADESGTMVVRVKSRARAPLECASYTLNLTF